MRDRTRQCLDDMLENARKALQYFEEDREAWRQVCAWTPSCAGSASLAKPPPACPSQIGTSSRTSNGEKSSACVSTWCTVYDKVDLDILEGLLHEDLPNLVRQLEQLLS